VFNDFHSFSINFTNRLTDRKVHREVRDYIAWTFIDLHVVFHVFSFREPLLMDGWTDGIRALVKVCIPFSGISILVNGLEQLSRGLKFSVYGTGTQRFSCYVTFDALKLLRHQIQSVHLSKIHPKS
jgi:hypothetical protein